MTTNKRNQDRTGQLSMHNIFYQTVVAVTQFIQNKLAFFAIACILRIKVVITEPQTLTLTSNSI